MAKLKLKPKPKATFVLRVKQTQTGLDDADIRRYLLPPPTDLPLLREHYDGEWFQRIDGCSVCQRWKDKDGVDHHRLIFYPAKGMQERLDLMEHNWSIRNDFLLLLWKMLQKFGTVDYNSIPGDAHYNDFDKYLNRQPSKPKMKLKLKPNIVIANAKKFVLKLKEAV
jgi:hypothetical protein